MVDVNVLNVPGILYLCTNTICIWPSISTSSRLQPFLATAVEHPHTHSAFTPQCPNSYPLCYGRDSFNKRQVHQRMAALTFQHYADNSQTPPIAFVSDSSVASSTLIARVLPPFHPPDSLALCFPWGGQGAMTPGRHVPARGRLAPCPGCTVLPLGPPPAQQ